jgi:hypothetical protein
VFASSNYPPDQAAADRFVAEMRHGTLIALAPGGYPQVSILPFVKTDDVIELHCVQADPTFDAVRANPRVTFFVSDFLAWSPHSWVDEKDGGRATLHFRAVAFECDVERASTDPEDVAGALSRLLATARACGAWPRCGCGSCAAMSSSRRARRAPPRQSAGLPPGCASAASRATCERRT